MIVIAFVLSVGLAADTVRAEPRGEVVRFVASDGVTLVGDYYAADVDPAPVVVLVHMMRSDRHAWGALIPALHKAHFAVLTIDLRGHGESGSPKTDELRRLVREKDKRVFQDMSRDVEASIEWLLGRTDIDKSRIGLIGAGVGWNVALAYAVDDASIDAVVGLTPQRGAMGIDSMTATLMYAKRPMLLLAVETDRRALETLTRMNPGVVGEIVGNGTGHGTRMLSRFDGLPARIATFMSSSLGAMTPNPVMFVRDDKTYYYEDVQRLRVTRGETAAKRIRWFSSAEEAAQRGFKAAP